MIYEIAHKVSKIIKWIWLGLILIFLVALTANILVVKKNDFSETIFANVLNQILNDGNWRIAVFTLIATFIIITLSTYVLLIREQYSKYDLLIKRYLHLVIEANQGLSPNGFAQQSQALISVNVPLDDIFIHLNAVPDRPVYDVPSEQQKLLEELRQRKDLSIEEREELIQRIRVIWYSQVGKAATAGPRRRNISIEKVLEQLNTKRPVAVILGTPGSGKSTLCGGLHYIWHIKHSHQAIVCILNKLLCSVPHLPL